MVASAPVLARRRRTRLFKEENGGKKKKKKMRKEGRIFMAPTVRRLPRMRMHISLDV